MADDGYVALCGLLILLSTPHFSVSTSYPVDCEVQEVLVKTRHCTKLKDRIVFDLILDGLSVITAFELDLAAVIQLELRYQNNEDFYPYLDNRAINFTLDRASLRVDMVSTATGALRFVWSGSVDATCPQKPKLFGCPLVNGCVNYIGPSTKLLSDDSLAVPLRTLRAVASSQISDEGSVNPQTFCAQSSQIRIKLTRASIVTAVAVQLLKASSSEREDMITIMGYDLKSPPREFHLANTRMKYSLYELVSVSLIPALTDQIMIQVSPSFSNACFSVAILGCNMYHHCNAPVLDAQLSQFDSDSSCSLERHRATAHKYRLCGRESTIREWRPCEVRFSKTVMSSIMLVSDHFISRSITVLDSNHQPLPLIDNGKGEYIGLFNHTLGETVQVLFHRIGSSCINFELRQCSFSRDQFNVTKPIWLRAHPVNWTEECPSVLGDAPGSPPLTCHGWPSISDILPLSVRRSAVLLFDHNFVLHLSDREENLLLTMTETDAPRTTPVPVNDSLRVLELYRNESWIILVPLADHDCLRLSVCSWHTLVCKRTSNCSVVSIRRSDFVRDRIGVEARTRSGRKRSKPITFPSQGAYSNEPFHVLRKHLTIPEIQKLSLDPATLKELREYLDWESSSTLVSNLTTEGKLDLLGNLTSQPDPKDGKVLVNLLDHLLSVSTPNMTQPTPLTNQSITKLVDVWLENVPLDGSSIQLQTNNVVMEKRRVHLGDHRSTSFEVEGNNTLVIPQSAIPEVRNGSSSLQNRSAFFVYYKNPILFSPPDTDTRSCMDGYELYSRTIISSVVGGGISQTAVYNLSEPVLISIDLSRLLTNSWNSSIPDELPDRNIRCVFWNYNSNEGKGSWSGEGCSLRNSSNGSVLCECNHLTNFAASIDYYAETSRLCGVHATVLTLMSYIGCSVSLIGLLLTIGFYLRPFSLRGFNVKMQKISSIVLVQLCLALACLMVLILVDYRNDSRSATSCVALGASVHFFVLSSFVWMLMEAIFIYKALVVVIFHISCLALAGLSALSWGASALLVLTLAVVVPDSYRGLFYCLPSGKVLLYGLILPCCSILVFNLIIFSLVMISLCRSASMQLTQGPKSNQQRRQVRRAIGIVVLLGITWSTGFVAHGPLRLYMQYLFVLLNSLQGFIIFVFYCLTQPLIRRSVLAFFTLGHYRPLSESRTASVKCIQKGASRPLIVNPRIQSSTQPFLIELNSTLTASGRAEKLDMFSCSTPLGAKELWGTHSGQEAHKEGENTPLSSPCLTSKESPFGISWDQADTSLPASACSKYNDTPPSAAVGP